MASDEKRVDQLPMLSELADDDRLLTQDMSTGKTQQVLVSTARTAIAAPLVGRVEALEDDALMADGSRRLDAMLPVAAGVGLEGEGELVVDTDDETDPISLRTGGVERVSVDEHGIKIRPAQDVGDPVPAQASLRLAGNGSGFYGNTSQVVFMYGNVPVWYFGTTDILYGRGNNPGRIQAIGARSWLRVGGRVDHTADAKTSLHLVQYADLPFTGANVHQGMVKIEAKVKQTGTASFDALAIETDETENAGTGPVNAINIKTNGTQRFHVRTDGTMAVANGDETGGAGARPAIAGMSRPSTGISFNATSDALFFLLNGSKGAQLSSSGFWLGNTGSAASPALKHLSYAQSGLFWHGTGALGLSSNGNEIARVEPTGRLNLRDDGRFGWFGDPDTYIENNGGLNTIDVIAGGLKSACFSGGQLLAAPGTELFPGLAGDGFQTSGFRWPATGSIHVGLGGTDRYRFTNTAFAPAADHGVSLGTALTRFKDTYSERVLVNVGVPAAPSIASQSHPSTGLRWISATDIGVVTNGSDRLILSTNHIRPSSAGGASLGTSVYTFGDGYINRVLVADGTFAAPSIAPAAAAGTRGIYFTATKTNVKGDLNVTSNLSSLTATTQELTVNARALMPDGSPSDPAISRQGNNTGFAFNALAVRTIINGATLLEVGQTAVRSSADVTVNGHFRIDTESEGDDFAYRAYTMQSYMSPDALYDLGTVYVKAGRAAILIIEVIATAADGVGSSMVGVYTYRVSTNASGTASATPVGTPNINASANMTKLAVSVTSAGSGAEEVLVKLDTTAAPDDVLWGLTFRTKTAGM